MSSSVLHRLFQKEQIESGPRNYGDLNPVTLVPGERPQARVRLAVVSVLSVYVIVQHFADPAGSFANLFDKDYVVLAFALVTWYSINFLWARWVSVPGRPFSRRVVHRLVGIVTDAGFTSLALHMTGEMGAPLCIVYLWITFGYGVRYGQTYLLLTSAASIIGFAVATLYTPFWTQHAGFAIGIMVGLIVLPTYVLKLLSRLRETLDQTQHAYEAKTQFIANMSHELRTPLNGIIAVSELLKEKLGGHQAAEEMLTMIRSSADTQLHLINQILDLSKSEAGRMVIDEQPFDLHGLLREVMDIVWPQATAKGLQTYCYVDLRLPSRLQGGREQLKQVLVNICGNAVKFTENGRVALRVELAAVEGEALRVNFTVIDTGIGMSKEAVARIFDPFTQGDNSITRRYGGTGLGTTISRQLVRLMGGDIRVVSEEGKGSTFEISARLKPVAEAGNVSDVFNIKLLAIGLDERDQRALGAMRRAGVDTTFVPRWSKAEAMLAQGGWDALLLDDRDPGQQGPSPIARAFESGWPERRPIIAVGQAHQSAALAAQGYSAWAPELDDPKVLQGALNLVRCARQQTAATARPARVDFSARVLVAEDNPTNQRVARMVLERLGHEVEMVDNGMAAMERLEDGLFDLALLDFHMPEMSGVEVAQLYRAATPSGGIPLVLLTADVTEQARQTARRAGIDKFLSKPFEPSQVAEAIEELLGEGLGRASPAGGRITPVRQAASPPGEALLNERILDDLVALGGDLSFIDDLLTGFRRDGDAELEAARGQLAAGDLGALRDTLHALKGSARNVGATRLSDRIAEIERMSDQALAPKAAELIDEVQMLLQLSWEGLQAYRESLARGERPPARH